MEINKEIVDLLKKNEIPPVSGLLYLLGHHFKLDVEKVFPTEFTQSIDDLGIITATGWTLPMFDKQPKAFDWVRDWIKPFGERNPERKGVTRDCVTRMQKFFSEYPEYRKEDVYKARDMYLATVKDPQYLKSPHKLIFEGNGVMRTSLLLQWCEKASEAIVKGNPMRGLVK